MKLPVPFIQLPLQFDAGVLAAEIAAIGESQWRQHPNALPGNTMLPLISVNGDAANETFVGPMSPTPELQRCPYLMQVMASFGATLGRSRLMRLAGQAEVTRHVDQGYYWAERVRVHVPVVTQPSVRFECGDAAIHMAAGECWLFDTWRQHRVINDASAARIHLVADTMGGGDFWDLVARGRGHAAAASPNWAAQVIAPRHAATQALACESTNVPVVMTPWEMNAHFVLLFSDAIAHRQLAPTQHRAQRFAQEWRGLWARFGEAPEGRMEYQQALRRFIDEVKPISIDIALRNELSWFSAMTSLIGKAAIQPFTASVEPAGNALEDRS